MAKIFDVQVGDYSEFILRDIAGAVVEGTYVLTNDVAGFYFEAAAIGDDVTVVTKARKVKVEKDAVATAQGEPAYWNGATSKVTNIAGALRLIGFFNTVTVGGDTHGEIELDGFAAFLKA